MDKTDSDPPPQRPPRRQKRKLPPVPATDKGEAQQIESFYDFARPNCSLLPKSDSLSCSSVYDVARPPVVTTDQPGVNIKGTNIYDSVESLPPSEHGSDPFQPIVTMDCGEYSAMLNDYMHSQRMIQQDENHQNHYQDDEHIYDEVYNSRLSLNKAAGKGSTGSLQYVDGIIFPESQHDGIIGKKSEFSYDEVVTFNQEVFHMPTSSVVDGSDDDDSELNDDDPWGSDFSDSSNEDFEADIEEAPGEVYEDIQSLPKTPPRRANLIFPAVNRGLEFLSAAGHQIATKQLKKPKVPKMIKGCFGKGFGLKGIDSKSYYSLSGQDDEDNGIYVNPNVVGAFNYPVPAMPSMKENLGKDQVKRYQIVKSILESEASYMTSLDTLIKNYEEPCRERDLLEKEKIDMIFYNVHKILDCHVMFNIALSERMSKWCTDDQLGDIFYASFSKSMVLEVYSGFVNNFSRAIDTIKTACKTHVAFAQFLRARRQSTKKFMGRLSLHGLMLKPVQRFPQFILFLQDLLDVTPPSHSDRLHLQLALTQIECLAGNLNERKRESEIRHKVRQLDHCIRGLGKPLSKGSRYFVRQDDMTLCVLQGDSVVKTKKRRLIVLSDMLICVSLLNRKQQRVPGGIMKSPHKYKLKWNVPLTDVEVVEYGPGVNVSAGTYKTTISYDDKGKYRQQGIGFQMHFEDLQHDLAIIGQIAGLVATLRRFHPVLDSDKVQTWYRSIKTRIEEETKMANLYWLELSLPSARPATTPFRISAVPINRHGRVNYIFNTTTPKGKAEWVSALSSAKLKLAPENNPGWYLPEDDGAGAVAVMRRNIPLLRSSSNLFMISPKATVDCAVTFPAPVDPNVSASTAHSNFVWVCSSADHLGQVSIVKVGSNIPQVLESFHVSESAIFSVEYVKASSTEGVWRGATDAQKYGFPFPTIWLGTLNGRIFIYKSFECDSKNLMFFTVRDAVLVLKCVDQKIFAGLADGTLVIFKPDEDGMWNFADPKLIKLGNDPIMGLAEVSDMLWCGCGNKVFAVNISTEEVEKSFEVDPKSKSLVKHLVRYGVGVWVSVWKSCNIKLFHIETLEQVQEINVASSVAKMQDDIDTSIQGVHVSKLYVTTMTSVEGLLWVGTSEGIILTFPLPRLQGVPLVLGRPCVSFHGHRGPVRCLIALDNDESFDELETTPTTLETETGKEIFRHSVDVEVQTDSPGDYASNGPEVLFPSIGKSSSDPKVRSSTPTSADQLPGMINSYQHSKDSFHSWLESFQESPAMHGNRGDDNLLSAYDEENEESIHSDDEFSFIEDKMKIMQDKVDPAFTVNIKQNTESPSEVNVELFSQKVKIAKAVFNKENNDVEVDDFARMMAEFQGFSTITDGNDPKDKIELQDRHGKGRDSSCSGDSDYKTPPPDNVTPTSNQTTPTPEEKPPVTKSDEASAETKPELEVTSTTQHTQEAEDTVDGDKVVSSSNAGKCGETQTEASTLETGDGVAVQMNGDAHTLAGSDNGSSEGMEENQQGDGNEVKNKVGLNTGDDKSNIDNHTAGSVATATGGDETKVTTCASCICPDQGIGYCPHHGTANNVGPDSGTSASLCDGTSAISDHGTNVGPDQGASLVSNQSSGVGPDHGTDVSLGDGTSAVASDHGTDADHGTDTSPHDGPVSDHDKNMASDSAGLKHVTPASESNGLTVDLDDGTNAISEPGNSDGSKAVTAQNNVDIWVQRTSPTIVTYIGSDIDTSAKTNSEELLNEDTQNALAALRIYSDCGVTSTPQGTQEPLVGIDDSGDFSARSESPPVYTEFIPLDENEEFEGQLNFDSIISLPEDSKEMEKELVYYKSSSKPSRVNPVLVISAGEGHKDLRLKSKPTDSMGKPETMFLLWQIPLQRSQAKDLSLGIDTV